MILFVEVEIAIRFQVKISRKISDIITNKMRFLLAPLHTIYITIYIDNSNNSVLFSQLSDTLGSSNYLT